MAAIKILPTAIITRPEGAYAGADKLRAKLEGIGFKSELLPVSKVEQLNLTAEAKDLVRQAFAAREQWLAFLSPSAVFVFKNLLSRIMHSEKIPPSISLAAQGKGTADAISACFGRKPDFMPTVFVAEEFAAEFANFIADDSSILVPQSADGRDVFGPILRARGFSVETIDTYCLVDAPLSDELRKRMQELAGMGSYIIFMSPSAVRAVARAFKDYRPTLEALRIVSVGPITSQAVRESGLEVFAEAIEHSEDGVIAELAKVAEGADRAKGT